MIEYFIGTNDLFIFLFQKKNKIYFSINSNLKNIIFMNEIFFFILTLVRMALSTDSTNQLAYTKVGNRIQNFISNNHIFDRQI